MWRHLLLAYCLDFYFYPRQENEEFVVPIFATLFLGILRKTDSKDIYIRATHFTTDSSLTRPLVDPATTSLKLLWWFATCLTFPFTGGAARYVKGSLTIRGGLGGGGDPTDIVPVLPPSYGNERT